MLKTREVPQKVALRDERVLVPISEQTIRDPDPAERYKPYVQKSDARLNAIVAKANGQPATVIRLWFDAVRPRLQLTCGVHLIPGQIQRAANLPVRQVYIHYDEVYRIEADGRITACFAQS